MCACRGPQRDIRVAARADVANGKWITIRQLSSKIKIVISIENLDQLNFGSVSTQQLVYKAQISGGLPSYKTQTLTIIENSSATTNNLGMFEDLADGTNLGHASISTSGYTTIPYKHLDTVVPSGNPPHYVNVLNITDANDYLNEFTFSFWTRGNSTGGTQNVFFRFGDTFLQYSHDKFGIIGGPDGTVASNVDTGLHNGAGNNYWMNYVFTWSPNNGLKVYKGRIRDFEHGRPQDHHNSFAFSLIYENANIITANAFNSIEVGSSTNGVDQRHFDGCQIIKKELSSEEIYGYLRNYLLDSTILLG